MAQQKTPLTPLHQQGLLFLIVGSLNALLHFLSLIFFVQILHQDPIIANILAFCIAFVFGFIGHLKLTFQAVQNKADWKHSLAKWFASSVLGFMLNQTIFSLAIEYFGQQYYVLIWIIATALVTLCTFSLAKFWAFRGKRS